MIGTSTLNSYALFFKLSHYFNGLPFDWDPEHQQLIKAKFNPFLDFVVQLFAFSNVLTNLVSLALSYQEDQVNVIDSIIDLCWLAFYGTVAFGVMHISRNKDDYRQVFNQILGQVTLATRFFDKGEVLPAAKVLQKFVFNQSCSIFSGAACFWGVIFIQPGHRRYLYYYFPEVVKSPVSFGFWAIFEYFCYLRLWFVMWYPMFTYPLYVVVCRGALKRVIGSKTSGSGVSINFMDKINLYKQFQVLNSFVNQVFRVSLLQNIKIFNLVNHAASLLGLVIFHDRVNTFMILGFMYLQMMWLTFEMVVYPFIGRLQEQTLAFKIAMGREIAKRCHRTGSLVGGASYERMVHRSLKTFAAQIGSLYFFKRDTAMTFFSVVFSLSVNVILLHK